MLTYFPMFKETVILVTAAVIPALLLLFYIYRTDRHEKEPWRLLRSLLLGGVLASFPAMALELLMDDVILLSIPINETIYMGLVGATTGMIEEGCKFFFLKRFSWHDTAFNYLYDGVVYAVFVSLGFAAFENVFYVFQYGLEVAGLRALLAIPGHTAFSVLMGVHYGRAKLADIWGKKGKVFTELFLAWFMASLFHGIYDACAMIGTDTAMAAFFVFIAVMYITMFTLVRRGSRNDKAMY